MNLGLEKIIIFLVSEKKESFSTHEMHYGRRRPIGPKCVGPMKIDMQFWQLYL